MARSQPAEAEDTRQRLLQAGLALARRGGVKALTVRAVAKEFVKEEAEHVEKLKQWIAQEEAAVRRATAPAA